MAQVFVPILAKVAQVQFIIHTSGIQNQCEPHLAYDLL